MSNILKFLFGWLTTPQCKLTMLDSFKIAIEFILMFIICYYLWALINTIIYKLKRRKR